MSITITAPTIEHHREPMGIGESAPRLSWKTQAPAHWRQSGYEIEAVIAGAAPEAIRVESADSVLVAWPFRPLASRERAAVRVRVFGAAGESEWSAPTELEIGLLEATDWSARPVGAGWDEGEARDDRRPALVRHSFEVAEAPASARLYVTAHGLYEVEINGARVGAEAMAPGWTVYGERLRYATYDVTELITAGENAIGSWLGDGWYRGRMGWNGGFFDLFGSDIGLIAQLELRSPDGSIRTISTDAGWKASFGPIIRTGNYDGEVYDARREQSGWSSPGFDDAAWTPVRVGERDPGTLEAPVGPPVRCTEEVAPVGVLTTPSGRRVLDFGQNLVGRPRIRLTGAAAGDTVRMSTAEVLQDGEIYTRPLRSALSTDVYTAAGRAEETWEPRFTVHGFQYIDVSGWPGDLDADVAAGAIVARVYHTDMERTGWFDSSNELVNKLHENIVWGMRGNFLDVPTDCPQRDERVGWTGDIQVFAPTASFLYDCSGMLDSWLRDVAIEQLPDGTIPWYVPVIPAHRMWTPIRPGAVWGDVAVLTPWTLYERFGDARIVARQYDSARRWVDLMTSLAGPDRLWDEGFQLGDWLDPDAPPQDPADAKTDRYLVATAYFAWSTAHLAKMAELLGEDADADRYAALAEEVRAAFVGAYVTDEGRMTSDAQTAYALAIRFGLLSEEQERLAGSRLAELVAEARNRISTGFAGTPIINDALSATGHDDASFALLLEQECPSWLYQVAQGATTVWERWDSMLPDGTVNPGTMTSFNHYALGSVADWMHRVLAGLAPAEPGYRRVIVEPRLGGGFTHASAAHESPYGRISVAWSIEGDQFVLEVELPTGTAGVLRLPDGTEIEVGPGAHRATAVLDAASTEVRA